MGPKGDARPRLRDTKVDVKTKLSALWVSVMLMYVYVDFFGLFQPGSIESILDGKVWLLDITPTWAFGALAMMAIPSLMVFLSLVLPAQANRWTNIIVGVLYLAISVGNSIGETWAYYYLGSAVEAILLLFVLWYAVKWPNEDASA